jgi:hypothetical protein
MNVTSSFLGPNIPLSTLFSNTLNLCSYLNVRETKFHTAVKDSQIIVLYTVPLLTSI